MDRRDNVKYKGAIPRANKMTPNRKIVAALRRLSLRSSEKTEALKRAKYTCEHCGVKRSRAKGAVQKVEVHHKKGVLNWDELIKAVRLYLLCSPEHLEVLCPTCHKGV